MQYQNSGNPVVKNLLSAFSFIALIILLFTTATVLLQVIAIAALVGGSIWGVLKFAKFVKNKILNKTSTIRQESKEKLVVEIVKDPEMQDSFTHKNIIDVEYEEI